MEDNQINSKNIEITRIETKNSLKNSILKTKSSTAVKMKQIKNKRMKTTKNSNLTSLTIDKIYFKTISNKENSSSKKYVSNYVSINKSFLLEAYEKSLTILFDALKLYMKHDLLFFNKLKINFIKNVHNFYQKNKNKLSIIIKTNKSEPASNSKIFTNKKYDSYTGLNNCNNKSYIKPIFGLSNNLGKESSKNNISKSNIELNNKKYNIENKMSLCALMKNKTRTIRPKNNINNIIKNDCNISMLKKFLEFNKNIKNKRNKIVKKNFNNKTDKDINNNYNNKNNISDNIMKINNKIYCNKTINKIPNEVLDKEQKIIEDNDLIIFIKNSLDDNLKNFFDFSYKSFLNEESEREV